jgi:hypothetical protein
MVQCIGSTYEHIHASTDCSCPWISPFDDCMAVSHLSRDLIRRCRPTTFFRIPLAHAFLNGLVKGFWRLVNRDKATNDKLTHGREVILDAASVRMIGCRI